MERVYICDEKYQNIIDELNKRGWLLTPSLTHTTTHTTTDPVTNTLAPPLPHAHTHSHTHPHTHSHAPSHTHTPTHPPTHSHTHSLTTVPRECELMWMNLSKTRFATVLGRYVNHLKGIHHLSNKSYLVYHCGASEGVSERVSEGVTKWLLPPSWSSSCHSVSRLVGECMCYCATVLLCYCATALLCYCATVLLSNSLLVFHHSIT